MDKSKKKVLSEGNQKLKKTAMRSKIKDTDLEVSDTKLDVKVVKRKNCSLKEEYDKDNLKKSKKLKTEEDLNSEEDIDDLKKPKKLKTEKNVRSSEVKNNLKKSKKLKVAKDVKSGECGSSDSNAIDLTSFTPGDDTQPSSSQRETFIQQSTSSYGKHSNLAIKVAKQTDIPIVVANNIVRFFEEEATIPFLVRYRSEKIGYKSADELRHIKDVFKSMKQLEARASFIKKTLQSRNVLTTDMEYHINNCQTLSDLEELYEPFKPSKKSKIQEAYKIGIVDTARKLLDGDKSIRLCDIVDPKKEEIKDEQLAKDLLSYVIADFILKDVELASKLPQMYGSENIRIIVSKNKSSKQTSKEPKDSKENFAHYYDFNKHFRNVRPHQILAINRGEKLKELKVCVELPKGLPWKFERYLFDRWLYRRDVNYLIKDIVTRAIKDDVVKKIEKKIKKTIRTDLTAMGEKAALKVFSLNLKWLLLTRPVRNHTVLAIDPGYKHGCKMAVVSGEPKVLNTQVSNLNVKTDFITDLQHLINKYKVTAIAIGNGKGCRDVEKYIVEVIQMLKKENLELQYTIVSEQGLSIYSCSDIAKEEYPNLSPNLISAASLAKRVIDPLGEMIKVEPKHLGVGMYQHDMNPKRLDEMLNEVVSEVVSVVGVNLNTAPITLLKQVAGLSDSRAKAIIEFRESLGQFKQRNQLLQVKGIGKKTFEQCAGFIRIFPESGKNSIEPLDQTIIHPEDYTIANRFITEVCCLSPTDIGKDFFIEGVKKSTEYSGKANICKLLEISESSFNVIFEGLSKHLHYDIRMENAEQLFRKEITSFEDLTEGQIITGRVENVTPFGAFIDIGIGNSVLLPSCLNYQGAELHYGQKVSVKVSDINRRFFKVSLMLISVLSN